MLSFLFYLEKKMNCYNTAQGLNFLKIQNYFFVHCHGFSIYHTFHNKIFNIIYLWNNKINGSLALSSFLCFIGSIKIVLKAVLISIPCNYFDWIHRTIVGKFSQFYNHSSLFNFICKSVYYFVLNQNILNFIILLNIYFIILIFTIILNWLFYTSYTFQFSVEIAFNWSLQWYNLMAN